MYLVRTANHHRNPSFVERQANMQGANAPSNKLHNEHSLAILTPETMQILFAISVLFFCGIAWAAIAFARHIRAGVQQQTSIVPPRSDFKQHLFQVADAARLERIESPARQTPVHLKDLHQSVHDIAKNKDWPMPLPLHSRHAIHKLEPKAPQISLPKPPRPVRHGDVNLIDPAYFNKDLGDLTDPYEPTLLRANENKKHSSAQRY